MKFVAILLIAFIAAVYAAPSGPVSISDNNIGDIVTIGVNAKLDISSHIDQNIVNVIVALLNQQILAVGGADGQDAVEAPKIQITPEMIEKVKTMMNNN